MLKSEDTVLSKELLHDISMTLPKLKNSLTLEEVTRWLMQFEEDDRGYAIELLFFVQYITCQELQQYFDEFLQEIELECGEEETNYLLIPVGPLEKSGGMMSYFIRKTEVLVQKKRKVQFTIDLPRDPIDKKTTLILYDDFIGSGSTVISFVKEKNNSGKTFIDWVDDNPMIINRYLVSIFCLNDSGERVIDELKGFKLKTNKIYKSISNDPTPFDLRYDKKAMLNFIKKYGNKLKCNDGSRPPVLGFDDSEALVVFAYGCPDNTFPILWHDRKWIPAFPRFESGRIDAARELKKGIKFWYGLMNRLKIVIPQGEVGNSEIQEKLTPREDFAVLTCLKLFSMKFEKPIAAQMMGISIFELNKIIEIGRKRKLFTSKDEITNVGMELIHLFSNVRRSTSKSNLFENKYEIMYRQEYVRTKYQPGRKDNG